MITYTPSPYRTLQDQVSITLNQWLGYCPPAPYEHLYTTANDQGEVHLHGLLGCTYPLNDLIGIIRDVPGVRFVFNDVTLVYTGSSVAL